MKRLSLSVLIFLFPALLFAQRPSVEYKLSMPQPRTHFFEVEIRFQGLPASPSSLDVLMPVWRTGRYVIFDFPGGVQEFSAVTGDNSPLPWAKTDKLTWHIEKKRSTTVVVRYKVYANEFGDRTRGLNDEHAFVDGCAVFMYIERYRHLPLTLTVVPYKDWHVTTGLETVAGDQFKFSAPDFDYLIDCPLEIGDQQDYTFQVEGKEHVLSVYGKGSYNPDTLIKDITTIVKMNKEFWGDLPYKRYVFLIELTPHGGGGTEHINSTIIGLSPSTFKNSNSYRGFLGVVSHEYFHTWNVKRLRPKGILPYDFTRENYVKELWVAEGTTSYYGELFLTRAGYVPASTSLDAIAHMVQGDRQRPGDKIQSLDGSSFDAWIKFWKGLQQGYNSESDYYGKGANVSLLLDLEIRQRSNNKYSLDDVMRTLYQRFPLAGGRGYTDDDVQKVSEEFAGSSFKTFFDNYVHGTAPLAWETALRYAGLDLQAKDAARKTWLGVWTSDQNGRARVNGVIAGSPAYEAGLDYGDEILAIDGQRIRSSDLQNRIAEFKPGDKVKISLFRGDELREFDVTLRLQDVPPYKIVKVEKPTDLQKAIYESWLRTKWE
jgi:predicted metalloprotease with PDZ domain